jgi:hypothetical protein
MEGEEKEEKAHTKTAPVYAVKNSCFYSVASKQVKVLWTFQKSWTLPDNCLKKLSTKF